MLRRRFALILALGLATAGCMHKSGGKDPFKTVTTSGLDAMRKTAGSRVAVFDANENSYREKHGKIAGATLLSNFKSYDLAELPAAKDTPLVFYCTSRF